MTLPQLVRMKNIAETIGPQKKIHSSVASSATDSSKSIPDPQNVQTKQRNSDYISAIGQYLLGNTQSVSNYNDNQSLVATARNRFHLRLLEAVFNKTVRPVFVYTFKSA